MYKEFYYFGRKYELSEYGNVIACENTKLVRYNYSGKIIKKLRTTHRKELKPYKDKDGYNSIQLQNNKHSRHIQIHHLVYYVFIKGIKNIDDTKMDYDYNKKIFYQINHIDGNKENNHYSNLELVTLQENIQHAVKIGIHNSQTSAVYVDIYRYGKYITTIWKTREASKYIKDTFNVNIDCGTLSKYARNGNIIKGFSFKYKV